MLFRYKHTSHQLSSTILVETSSWEKHWPKASETPWKPQMRSCSKSFVARHLGRSFVPKKRCSDPKKSQKDLGCLNLTQINCCWNLMLKPGCFNLMFEALKLSPGRLPVESPAFFGGAGDLQLCGQLPRWLVSSRSTQDILWYSLLICVRNPTRFQMN